MIPDVALISLLSNEVTKLVFEEILKNRSVLFKDIRASILTKKPNAGAAQMQSAVNTLIDAFLVREREAGIEDFNTYYVTADGLTAERKLRLAESSKSSDGV